MHKTAQQTLRELNEFAARVRDAIAAADPTVPPHALTTAEIRAAYWEGCTIAAVAANFVHYYQTEIAPALADI